MDQNIFLATMFIISTSKNIFLFFSPILMFILTTFFNIKEYKFVNKEKVNSILQNIKHDYAFKFDENDQPNGIIIHKNKSCFIPYYICWVYECDYEKTIILYSNSKIREKLTKCKQVSLIEKKNNITNSTINNHTIDCYIQYGNYNYIRYTSRTIAIAQDFNANQKKIAETIIETYNNKEHLCCYLHGDIGKGKTMLCYILTKELNGSICDTFTPTTPGSYFEDLYTNIAPSKHQPFILLIDEVDIMLDHIHNQNVIQHKNISTQIYDKPTWNHFFDNIERGMYPYLIVILCSNISNSIINKKYDESYLRKGRIDHVFNL
tara:strand:+ start:1097 stop:2056 length:960 start_codon:yes stop_codon:yes gene_type:complete